ncbi:MAG: hypothetical protein HUU02_10615 [Bacteroidetes bacterium]|nr:hypothetical protein [Bacteroidota bacterium]
MKVSIAVFLVLTFLFSSCIIKKEESPSSPSNSSGSTTDPKPTFSISVSTQYGQGSQEGKTGTVKNTSNIYANQVYLKVNRTSGSHSINLGSIDKFSSKSFDTGLGAHITSIEVISN